MAGHTFATWNPNRRWIEGLQTKKKRRDLNSHSFHHHVGLYLVFFCLFFFSTGANSARDNRPLQPLPGSPRKLLNVLVIIWYTANKGHISVKEDFDMFSMRSVCYDDTKTTEVISVTTTNVKRGAVHTILVCARNFMSYINIGIFCNRSVKKKKNRIWLVMWKGLIQTGLQDKNVDIVFFVCFGCPVCVRMSFISWVCSSKDYGCLEHPPPTFTPLTDIIHFHHNHQEGDNLICNGSESSSVCRGEQPPKPHRNV